MAKYAGFCTILTKTNDVVKEHRVQSNLARTLSARANVEKFLCFQSCTWGIYLCTYQLCMALFSNNNIL